MLITVNKILAINSASQEGVSTQKKLPVEVRKICLLNLTKTRPYHETVIKMQKDLYTVFLKEKNLDQKSLYTLSDTQTVLLNREFESGMLNNESLVAYGDAEEQIELKSVLYSSIEEDITSETDFVVINELMKLGIITQ